MNISLLIFIAFGCMEVVFRWHYLECLERYTLETYIPAILFWAMSVQEEGNVVEGRNAG